MLRLFQPSRASISIALTVDIYRLTWRTMAASTNQAKKAGSTMDRHSNRHETDSFADLARYAQRVADSFTWLRLFVFAAMFIRISRAYVLTGDIDRLTYFGLWITAMIGCWTASGWLLHLPRLMFPNVKAVRHFRRAAPRA